MEIRERWRPVVGFEGFYEVSDLGRVRSLEHVMQRLSNGRKSVHEYRSPAKILKPQKCGRTGVLDVSLSRHGKVHRRKVHHLVLEAFVGPRPEGTEACHWNDVCVDNRLVNLRWDTKTGNAYDKIRNGNHPQAKKTHCPQGHEYTVENTIRGVKSNGWRFRRCRECNREHQRRYNLTRKSVVAQRKGVSS